MPSVPTARHRGQIVHREGRRPVGIVLVAAGVALLGIRLMTRGRIIVWAGVAALGSVGFVAQFFRHPGVSTPTETGLVVAPAYGRVVHIGIEREAEILADRRLRISIFLSLFDPHLTRSPVAGQITYQCYHPGRYLVALHPKASSLNERNSVLIECDDGMVVLVREIAGLIARRICSYVQPGSTVARGEEIGYIKLGSRVDLFLPVDATVLVRNGQYVTAGETPVARILPRDA